MAKITFSIKQALTLLLVLVSSFSHGQAIEEVQTVSTIPDESNKSLTFESSLGHKVKVEGQIELISELNTIRLPHSFVSAVHASSVRKGLCRLDQNTSEINCFCHEKEISRLPTITVSWLGDSQHQLELLPEDYLGEPYLNDYQVLCSSKLTSAAESESLLGMSAELHAQIEDRARQSRDNKGSKRHYLTSTYLPVGATPEENLKQECIFISVIAFFLIVIYIYLVFKKRKRINALKKQKELEKQQQQKIQAQVTSGEHSEQPSLLRTITSVAPKASMAGKNRKATVKGHSRSNSKSSYVKKTTKSRELKQDVSKVKGSSDLSRLSTDKIVTREDSLQNGLLKQFSIVGMVEETKQASKATKPEQTGYEYLASIQEDQSQD